MIKMTLVETQVTLNLAHTASEKGCSANTTDTSHGKLVKELQTNLHQQSDMVIDFSSLKICLNPMGIGDAQTLEKECDYKDLVNDLIENQTEKLPNLEKLTIRRVAKKPEQYDYYAQLSHGIMQMSCLSELDLCQIPAVFHDQLQLWNLYNLKKLSITESHLKSLSGSVGRLRKLECLDLSSNELSSLPITLSFCKTLNTLDLHGNHFKQLPGVILQLPNLQTLRRLQNPLTPRYQCGPHFTRKIDTRVTSTSGKTVYQPLSLQASCTTVVFTSKLEYWKMDFIGPLQCKTLDRLATQFITCDNCHRMLQAKALGIEVLLVTFVELSGVPFLLNACNETCQKVLVDRYGEKNIQLQKQMDRDYEASIKQALREVDNGTVNLGPAPGPYTPPHPWDTMHPYRSQRRRKRCSIM